MKRRQPDRITERIVREAGAFQPLPDTPEQVVMRRETMSRETEGERKTRLLSDFDRIVPAEGSATAEQVRETAHNKFFLLELEVFVYRLYETGPRSRSSYAEIAARLADTYHDPRIDENLVLMVANAAREKIWNALDAGQQDAVRKQKQGTHKLPKRVQNFILGLDAV